MLSQSVYGTPPRRLYLLASFQMHTLVRGPGAMAVDRSRSAPGWEGFLPKLKFQFLGEGCDGK